MPSAYPTAALGLSSIDEREWESHDPAQVHRPLCWISPSLTPLNVSTTSSPSYHSWPLTVWILHWYFQWYNWASPSLSWRGHVLCNLQDLGSSIMRSVCWPFKQFLLMLPGPSACDTTEPTSLYWNCLALGDLSRDRFVGPAPPPKILTP